ncbi:cytidylyltransferase domain-containing protein [Flavobacterium sp. WC2509]|uniref:cytidylyltransferase domain-containing protein n=1 Tax=Flavobacterium sp. WC2509 TaxID=3461406 RepID=UPI004044E5F8
MIKKDKITLGVVIQARTGSSRLPNKILKNFYNNESILDILLENIKSKFSHLPIILATSTNEKDNILSEVAAKWGVHFYRGSEENVLKRFIDVGENYGLTHLVRICSDNPFLNMDSIAKLIEELTSSNIDYLSYSNHLGIPVIKTHIGLFTEIVSLKALLETNKRQNELIYQEHVTNFIYSNPQYFNINLLKSPVEVHFRDDIRLTLDDEDDFENLASLYKSIKSEKENLGYLVDYIDLNKDYKIKMINNIKKYSK